MRGLCSADGRNWFAVGHVDFPVRDPVEVGLYAIGSVDRVSFRPFYPGIRLPRRVVLTDVVDADQVRRARHPGR